MGFLGRFLVKRKIFLGLYEENFLNSEEFLRAAEDFPASANAFSKQYLHLSNLKNH
jgi:hypothetical protein